MIYHCGVFVYKKKPIVLELMDDWFQQYCDQIRPEYDSRKKSIDMYHFGNILKDSNLIDKNMKYSYVWFSLCAFCQY